MIIRVKRDADEKQFNNLIAWIKEIGLDVHLSKGETETIVGLVGNTQKVDIELIKSLDIVEDVMRISEPYKNTNRKFHPQDTKIKVANRIIGGNDFQIIAGPCSVETEEQIIKVAQDVKEAGATFLRGGAFKPRSSPYSFQGLGLEGLKMLVKAKQETGLPIVTEIMSEKYLDHIQDVDVIQIGARNMQNFDLLKALGQVKKPILLKRGLANTMEEWLMSAEYILASGNSDVILCERGIRTFESYTRNTLDLAAVTVLKEKTHLPIIVDPSHAIGVARWVGPSCLAAAAIGADGLIIEVHNNPSKALSDGAQSIRPNEFKEIVQKVEQILPIVGKKKQIIQ